MSFLNIGWPEILFIFIIGFLVLGPDRIVKHAQELGQWLRKLKSNETFREVVKTTDEIRNYPRKIMEEARFEDIMLPQDPVQEPQKQMQHPMTTRGSVGHNVEPNTVQEPENKVDEKQPDP
ncbi:MAG: twin-arginine translocase TatA/TatE family subunit [Anaerolineaceae bacterium]|nr:twin-arginine translocase TatA/TatE family subunit [Anaerolineaceae bacterium]